MSDEPDQPSPRRRPRTTGRSGGSLVRAIRSVAGIGQRELAARMGLEQADISRLEGRGSRVMVETLERVAKAAGVRVTWAITGADTGADTAQPSETTH